MFTHLFSLGLPESIPVIFHVRCLTNELLQGVSSGAMPEYVVVYQTMQFVKDRKLTIVSSAFAQWDRLAIDRSQIIFSYSQVRIWTAGVSASTVYLIIICPYF